MFKSRLGTTNANTGYRSPCCCEFIASQESYQKEMSSSSYSNFDNLLLQSLGRLHLRPPYLDTNSFLSQSVDDLLDHPFSSSPDDDNSDRSLLAKEESNLEKELVRIIASGKTDTLKANSGQSVAIGEHHVCVGCHEEPGSGYKVWEWHGHIMLFDEENGYTPEYIYGNYFERVQRKAPPSGDERDGNDEETRSGGGNFGLKDLVADCTSTKGPILQRGLNVRPSR